MPINRRQMLSLSGFGFGQLAAAHLLAADRSSAVSPASGIPIYGDLHSRPSHFPAQAESVIQLVQNGGPSQMDLFDPKPELTRLAGKPHPDGVEIHQPT